VAVDEANSKVTIPNPEEPHKLPKAWTFDAVYGKVGNYIVRLVAAPSY
jgi:hypothetical protein